MKNETTTETQSAIGTVITLLSAKRTEALAAGPELLEKAEVLEAIETSIDMLMEISSDIEDSHTG